MRILHIPHAYAPVVGGAELLCKRVGEELAVLGHSVRVVTADVGSVDGYYEFGVPPVRQGRSLLNGVEVVRIPYGGLLYEPIGRWASGLLPQPAAGRVSGRLLQFIRYRFAARLEREILAYRPDVVMTLPHLVVNVAAVLRIRKTVPFPLVVVPLIHEHQSSFSPGALQDLLRTADATVALTEREATLLKADYGVPADSVHNTGVGMDLPEYRRTPARADTVVFLGRKDPAKGIPALLKAMQSVWKHRPEASLVLAGARAPGTLAVDRMLGELPASQRVSVRSLDDISEREKMDLLSSACCLVLPSRIESFGLVILEAWAAGIPVVTYDLPVFRCTVDDGVNGLLVDPGSESALPDAILRLLGDRVLADRLGAAGRQKLEREYRWELVAKRFLGAYEYAVAKHARSRYRGLAAEH